MIFSNRTGTCYSTNVELWLIPPSIRGKDLDDDFSSDLSRKMDSLSRELPCELLLANYLQQLESHLLN